MSIDTPRPAADQMACDEALARAAEPAVRFYRWDPPAISLGLKQSAPAWVMERCDQSSGVEVVERPTGGGIAFHGSDVSLAVVVPRAFGLGLRQIMDAVCHSAVELCRRLGVQASAMIDVRCQERLTYCALDLSPYAVLSDGRKIAGFAARRYPQSWLIHGWLLVRPVAMELFERLPREVQQRLVACATSLAVCADQPLDEVQVAQRWAAGWPAWWEQMIAPIWNDEFADQSAESLS